MIEAITIRRRVGLPSLHRLASLGIYRGFVPREGEKPAPTTTVVAGLTEQQVKDIIARDGHGDSRKAIRVLARDRAKASERARVAEERWDKAEKTGLIAKEGEVIVRGDLAKQWPEVEKFLTENKLDFKKLIEQAGKVPEIERKQAEIEAKSRIAEAAKSYDFNTKALSKIIKTEGLELEERDITEEDEETGKKIKVKRWCTRKAGEKDAEWERLDVYAEDNFNVLMPALTASDDDEETEDKPTRRERQGSRNDDRRQQQKTGDGRGTRWPNQTRARTPETKKTSDDDLREKAIASGAYSAL